MDVSESTHFSLLVLVVVLLKALICEDDSVWLGFTLSLAKRVVGLNKITNSSRIMKLIVLARTRELGFNLEREK